MFTFSICYVAVFTWIAVSLVEASICEHNAHGRFCHKLFPTSDIKEYGFVPNEEELSQLCPKVLLYFDCLKSFIVIYCPNDSGIIESTFSTHAVARELCSVQSRLHKGYIKSVPCYKSIQKLGIPSQCGQKAETVYNGYLQDANEDYDVLEDSDRNRHRYCIEEAYKMACISQNIFEVCDEAAQNTFDELIVKSKALRRVCTQANIVELRTDFIDFLFIDEEDEDHLRTFFDF